MHNRVKLSAAWLATAIAVAGCAGNEPVYQPKAFSPVPIDSTAYVPAVDAFVILMDTSSSMAENQNRHFFAAKDAVNAMNQTIPELGYQGALVTFGPGCLLDKGLARIWYGPATYSTADLGAALGKIQCAGGVTPLDRGFDASASAPAAVQGKTAIFVVSDFRDIDSKKAMKALDALNDKYQGRICVHAVQLGEDKKATAFRDSLGGASNCSSAINATSIASSAALSDYITKTLLMAAPKTGDADGDGVADDRDRCPTTPPGARVNSVGCWWLGDEDVLFDFDKAVIKSTFMLDEAITLLKANREINVEIQGHTDNVGDPAYNVNLSQRRADAVMEYMIANGVSSSRLRAKGYGDTRPHVSNASDEGRALNRRVELHPYR